MRKYKEDFTRFLLENGVLQFGDFVTKSGRNTPYFVNTGRLNSGEQISKLGSFYAAHIMSVFEQTPAVIFGPAYKGIPLAVATASALFREHDKHACYSCDRKEEKTHGDVGNFLGKVPEAGDRLVIVEDVITAGTTLQSVVPKLRLIQGIGLEGVVISVDRCEVGASGDRSAVEEVQKDLGIKVFPLITVYDIIEFVSTGVVPVTGNAKELVAKMKDYLNKYGTKR